MVYDTSAAMNGHADGATKAIAIAPAPRPTPPD
jgi:hypothetical protein